jgi:hypothetical protein
MAMGAAKGAFAFLLAACAVALVLLASKDWRLEKSEVAHTTLEETLSLMNRRLEELALDIDRDAIESFKRERFSSGAIHNYIAMEEDGFHIVDSQITKRETLLEEHRRKRALEILKELDYGDVLVSFGNGIAATDQYLRSASFSWVDTPHQELIWPEFKWRIMPSEFSQACASASSVYFDNVPQEQSGSWLEAFAFPQGLKERAWTPENPLVIGKSLNIDVSEFYDESGNPVPTLIICQDKNLILSASQSGKAVMRGAIISSGGIQMMGVTFEGAALCKNNAYIYASSLKADPGMLFRIKLSSWNLQAMALDAFTGSSLGAGGSGMGSLNRLAISEESKVETRPAMPLKLEAK